MNLCAITITYFVLLDEDDAAVTEDDVKDADGGQLRAGTGLI